MSRGRKGQEGSRGPWPAPPEESEKGDGRGPAVRKRSPSEKPQWPKPLRIRAREREPPLLPAPHTRAARSFLKGKAPLEDSRCNAGRESLTLRGVASSSLEGPAESRTGREAQR